MILTAHAKERWAQRCHGLDFYEELTNSKPAGKRIINLLRKGWERSQGVGTWPAHHDYRVSPNGVVVVACGELVVTVMRTRQVKTWYADRRRAKAWRERAEARATPALPHV